MEIIVLNLLNGIAFGAILFLLAAGLSLTLGVMGIINMTHGAFYMVGGFVGWSVAVQNKMDFWLAVLMGALAAGVVGLVIERGFLRFLHGQPNEQVLLTFGFVYILTNLSLWFWGPLVRAPFTPPMLSSNINIMGWPYSISRIAIILIGLAMALGLWWLQDRTRIGAIIRAGMDDKEMIAGLGINIGLASAIIFFFGSFIAGGAGVIGAQLLGVSLKFGIEVLVFSLIVVIVGGLGSVQGALVGALLIGIIDTFGRAFFPDFAWYLIYIMMIVILLAKPSGLLGRKA